MRQLTTLPCLLLSPFKKSHRLAGGDAQFILGGRLVATIRCEVHAVIRFLNGKGVKLIEIYRQLTEVYIEACTDVK